MKINIKIAFILLLVGLTACKSNDSLSQTSSTPPLIKVNDCSQSVEKKSASVTYVGRNYQDVFGGVYYFVHEKNEIRVKEVGKNLLFEKAISLLFPCPQHLVFEQARFTQLELQDAYNTLIQAIDSNKMYEVIESIAVDIIHNYVEVNLFNLNNSNKERVNILVKMPQVLSFFEAKQIYF